MRLSEKQLRTIIREEAARLRGIPGTRVGLDDLEVGTAYDLTTKGSGKDNKWIAIFRGWYLDGHGQPRMNWEDADDGAEWESYLFGHEFVVGSSAIPLRVLRAVEDYGV